MGFDDIGVRAVVRNYTIFQRQLGSMDRSIAGFGRGAGIAGLGMGALNLALGAIVAGAAVTIAAIGGIALAIGKVGKASFDIAVSVETAFTGITKTTNDLVDTTTFQLTELGEQVKQEFVDLSGEIPVLLEDLMAIGEIAGQMGIPAEQLAGFTEQIAQIGVSTDMTEEAAAFALSRMAKIFDIADDDITANTRSIGSSLIALGNTFPTTEGKIMTFSDRIGGAGAALGFAQQDVLAIGAAMTSVGVEAQRGGTAVQKVMISMQEAIAGDEDALGIFAESMSLTNKEFKTLVETDPAAAFLAFTESLGDVGGARAIQTLKDLQLGDQRLIGAFLNLSSASGTLAEAMDLSNTSFEEGTALSQEAQKRWETFAEQWNLLKNKFRIIGLKIGEPLKQLAADFIMGDAVQDFVKTLGEKLPKAFERLTKVVTDSLIPQVKKFLKIIGIDITGVGLADFLIWVVDKSAEFVEWISSMVWHATMFIGLLKNAGLEKALEYLGFSPEAAENIKRIFDLLGKIVDRLKEEILKQFEKWSAWLQDNKDEFNTIFDGIVTILEKIGGIVTTIVIPTYGAWLDLLRDVFDVMLDILAGNWDELAGDMAAVRVSAIDLWETLIGGLAEFLGLRGFEEVKQNWILYIAAWKFAFVEAVGVVKGVFIVLWGGIKIAFFLMIAHLLNGFSILVGKMVSGINDVILVLNTVADFLGWDLIAPIEFVGWDEQVQTLRDKAAQAGQDMADALADQLEETLAMKAYVIENAFDAVLESKLDEFWDAGFNLGFEIMDGIYDGLTRYEQDVYNKVKNVARIIDQTFKYEWLISSPSKVAMEHGRQYMLGLAQGLEEATSAPVQAIKDAIVAMDSQIGPAGKEPSVTNINTNYNVSANYAKTQSPVRIVDDLALMGALSR